MLDKSPAHTEAAVWLSPVAIVGGGQVASAPPFGAGASPSFAPVGQIVPAPSATVLTSGSLTSTATTYNYSNYSTAPWVLSTGDGPYPDLGGVTTFNASTSITPGTLAGATTVTVNVSPTLSGITYNHGSPFCEGQLLEGGIPRCFWEQTTLASPCLQRTRRKHQGCRILRGVPSTEGNKIFFAAHAKKA